MSDDVILSCQLGRDRMTITGAAQKAYLLVEARPSDDAATSPLLPALGAW